jgi:alpha-L-rhamnosidase
MTLVAGTRIGPSEIQAPLGAGGMGEVYRACHTQMPRLIQLAVMLIVFLQFTSNAWASAQDEPLDPTAAVTQPLLVSSLHHPLPEQFIWIPGKVGTERAADRDAIRYFRKSFAADKMPSVATLYIAGPSQVRAYLNGKLIVNGARDPKSKISPFVVAVDVSAAIKPGTNVLALKTSRFPASSTRVGSVAPSLVVKIVPAPVGAFEEPLVVSGLGWKGSLTSGAGWEQPGFDDSAWAPAESLGSIEGDIERFQIRADAGLYRWPGYDGISPFLARIPLTPIGVMEVFEGRGHFENISSLTMPDLSKEFAVELPPASADTSEFPTLVLDLGREVNGRLEVASDSSASMQLELQYGESLEEALHGPYLGANELTVPAHAIAYGPKSAFRYARLRFLPGNSPLRFKSIRVDDIYYPVQYRGSFESSDQLLNRIWAVGAYTAHLCMVDGIWDSPKRDRGRWMGDLEVSGRVIETVFADQFLMKESLDQLIEAAGNPVNRHVNSISGYSAFWVMGVADYYRYSADKEYLRKMHDPLMRLLEFMHGDLDERSLFVNKTKSWSFVDWSPDLSSDTQEARSATQFEFYKAFVDAAWLLREADDIENAIKCQVRADDLKRAAEGYLLDSHTNTFGTRWQTNAMAVFSGATDAQRTQSIWQDILSRPSQFPITPYYNFYVIAAMARSGHFKEALDWIRQYWGAMVEQGASSFWEAYDPNWSRDDFHRHLQADNTSGYFVSLSHGWSSGPTAWLTEEILGIEPAAAGFSRVSIRPDLAGLTWARGTEPTPHGPIGVDYHLAKDFTATIDIPSGVQALVSMPVSSREAVVSVNGKPMPGSLQEQGTRMIVTLMGPGKYVIASR